MGDACSSDRGNDSESESGLHKMPSGAGTRLGDLLTDGESIPSGPEAWDALSAKTNNVCVASPAPARRTLSRSTSSSELQLPAPTSCEAKLRLCPEEVLTTLRQLLDNIRANPWDPRYRILYNCRPKVRSVLASPGCAQLLIQVVGFTRRERVDTDGALEMKEAEGLPVVQAPEWDTEEPAPFSQKAILVLGEPYSPQTVQGARVTVDSCLQEKAVKAPVIRDTKKQAATARGAEKSHERQQRDRILLQHKEQQERLRSRGSMEDSHAHSLIKGAKYNTCDSMSITHQGASVPPGGRPGG